MLRRIFPVFMAIVCVIFFALPANAYTGQQMICLPAGGFRFWDAASFEKTFGKHFEKITLTALPNSNRCSLYLNGKPLKTGQMLTRKQLSQVAMCTAKDSGPVTIGVFIYPPVSQKKNFRIRCINPKF